MIINYEKYFLTARWKSHLFKIPEGHEHKPYHSSCNLIRDWNSSGNSTVIKHNKSS